MQGNKDMERSLQYLSGPASGAGNSRNPGDGGNGSGRGETGDPSKDPAPPQKPPKKEKKPKGLKSQVSSKIQVCSSKLTDVKIWLQKVQESVLSLSHDYSLKHSRFPSQFSCD